jgi:hypothetical protein
MKSRKVGQISLFDDVCWQILVLVLFLILSFVSEVHGHPRLSHPISEGQLGVVFHGLFMSFPGYALVARRQRKG